VLITAFYISLITEICTKKHNLYPTKTGGINLKIVSLVISATALFISAGALALSIIALVMKVEK
jgi:predicted branched-subunit amino acid permease